MVCDSLASTKSIGPVFLTAFAHFVTVSLVILTVFQGFHDYINDLRSVISDVTVIIVLGPSETI